MKVCIGEAAFGVFDVKQSYPDERSDKGVVYCEMQGRENDEGSLVDRAAMDLLYPDTAERKSGYSAETGGKMANLRTLTVDTVRRYHSEYYTADNCLLIFSGESYFVP